jgi:hypothetical protein
VTWTFVLVCTTNTDLRIHLADEHAGGSSKLCRRRRMQSGGCGLHSATQGASEQIGPFGTKH